MSSPSGGSGGLGLLLDGAKALASLDQYQLASSAPAVFCGVGRCANQSKKGGGGGLVATRTWVCKQHLAAVCRARRLRDPGELPPDVAGINGSPRFPS